ncbi:hypothetical protein Tco_1115730 [Tanacetum coccineum]
MADETENVESVPIHSNDPLLSGEDSLKLNELIKLYTTLQKKVLDLETSKTTQTLKIESLKRRVKKLEQKQRSRTHKLRRLYKVSLGAKVIFSDDEASLGDQEDASKQGRKIHNIDADEDITLDSTHFDIDPDMFGVHDLHGDEVFVETEEPMVNAATTTSTILVSTATTTVDELTLAQTLIEIKVVKPKVRGVMIQETSETTTTTTTPAASKPSQDKGKAKMTEHEKPLKKKDQIMYDQENKSFAEIQKLFDKAMTRVNMFVDMDTELVKDSSKKVEEEMAKESSSKRAGEELEQEVAKKQKMEDDKEKKS